jgi:hypothetical protein
MTSPGLPVTFASWVQPRAAAGLDLDDANNNPGAPVAPPAPKPLTLGVVVANSIPDADGKLQAPQPVGAPHTDVRMLGPAGVVGIDPAQIVRRFPAPGTGLRTDTTNMACIEFAATDLPWRFTPATAITSGTGGTFKLRPWLVLIVVDAAIALTPVPGGPCPLITVPVEQLPDLKQSWAWAHVQLDGGLGPAGAGRARLLCPHRLPDQSFVRAVLVPAFKGGMLAAAADPDTRSNALTSPDVHKPAWDIGQPGPVTLPVYDEWTFATGDGEDFEALARLLKPVDGAAAAALGGRPIDIGHPFPADASNPTAVVPMPAALVPATTTSTDPPATAAAVSACATEIADRIKTAATLRQMGPPLRGGPQAGRTPPIAPTGGDWVDDANRDPRNRLAAARGADWVNAHQEELMADAWTQAGEIRAAAQRLAVARAAVAVTDSLHQRHVLPLTVDEQIALTAPAVARLRVQAAGTVATVTAPSLAQLLNASAAPNGLASTTSARLTRTRALAARATSATLTSKAIAGQFVGLPAVRTATPAPPLTTVPTATPLAVTSALRLLVDTVNQTAAQTRFQTYQLAVSTMATTLSPLHLSATVVKLTGPEAGANVVAVPATTTATLWQSAFTPAASVGRRVQSMIGTVTQTVGPVHRNVSAVTETLQPVLPTPQVGAPLALGLIERDPNWLVSGVDEFPLDRVTLLQPNKAFIEALMLGANHAMLDKYLWRGFPTDRRGTPIRRFWPTGGDSIQAINEWPANTALGSHLAGVGQGDLAFLLIRSQLFERYPETIIAAAKPTSTGPDLSTNGVIPPAMPMISIDSRTRIIGYPISHTVISTAPGCYFLLLEPPTGPRFGMEDDQWAKTSTRGCLDALAATGAPVTPVNSSAELASRTLRQTVRVIIHSTRLVSTQ